MNGPRVDRSRRLVARATGPSAITRWTWLVTAPLALTVMSGAQYVDGGPGAALGVASLEHAAIGVLLLAAFAVLRITPARVRAVVVVALFAAIGLLRPLLFLGAGAVLDIPVRAGDLASRIAINVVTMATAFLLIATAVDLIRDHLGVYRRLRAAQRASARDAERAADRVRELRHSAVDSVLAGIEEAADRAVQHGVRPQEAARLLRGLAEEVVRPASHRLYEKDACPSVPEVARTPVREVPLRAREWTASVFGGIAAAPPLLLALLFTALVTPFGLQEYGLRACVPLVVGLGVVWAGNILVARLVTVMSPRLRAVVLMLGYGAVGTLLACTSWIVLERMGEDPGLVWFEAGTYWIIGTGVALLSSLSGRIRLDQRALEAAVQAEVQMAAAFRADYDHERDALARMLHSGVQSELIAAALALGSDAGVDATEELLAVVDRIRTELQAPRVETPAPDRVAALVESWGSAIPLRTSIGEVVWARLREPARAAAVVDAISEGLANAVRHGDGTAVTLDVRPDGDAGVAVVVTSGGTLAGDRPGIGLRQLADRGEVALYGAHGRVELAVAIP